jgi:hypothetical protein
MGGRGVAAGVSLPFAMAGPIKTPHFSFLSERKEKRAVYGPKRKERFIKPGGKLRLGGTETRSPNRLDSAPISAAAAAVGEKDFMKPLLWAYFIVTTVTPVSPSP